MKRQEKNALFKKGDVVLQKEANELREQIQKTALDRSVGKGKNVRARWMLRKDRARILTILRQRALAGKSVNAEKEEEREK